MTRAQYIEKIKNAAIAACRGTGLFPSLMIAQAIVESGNGNSLLAAKYNNHFGIKASAAWRGKVVSMATREVYSGHSVMIKDGFRAYDSIEEGFEDRNRFLQQNPRYTTAGVFAARTPEEQAKAFQRAGYATDPKYASLLIAVINGSGRLKQYDNH